MRSRVRSIGSFALTGMPPGRYVLRVAPEEFARLMWVHGGGRTGPGVRPFLIPELATSCQGFDRRARTA